MNANTLNLQPRSHFVKNSKIGFSEGFSRPDIDPSYRNSSAAAAAHERSQFVLKELSSTWPSLDRIKRSAQTEWTIPSVKARIAELKLEHRQQLLKAIKYQVYKEQQLCDEQYQTYDNLELWASSTEATEMMKNLHRVERRLQLHQADDFISRLRYMHIMTLKPLYEKLHKLLIAEESAKAHRARQFPKTSQSWREMDTRDAKLKVAKFLLAEKKQQDEILTREPIWRENRADVDRVVLEYKSNIVFSQEVTTFVKTNQTTDPRRRIT